MKLACVDRLVLVRTIDSFANVDLSFGHIHIMCQGFIMVSLCASLTQLFQSNDLVAPTNDQEMEANYSFGSKIAVCAFLVSNYSQPIVVDEFISLDNTLFTNNDNPFIALCLSCKEFH